MKKEINPAVLAAVLAVLVVGAVAWFILAGRSSSGTVDLKTLDPKDLRDEDPVRRGQPGYRERTTDAPTR